MGGLASLGWFVGFRVYWGGGGGVVMPANRESTGKDEGSGNGSCDHIGFHRDVSFRGLDCAIPPHKNLSLKRLHYCNVISSILW